MPRECLHSWLDTYIDYTSKQKSPKSFHYWNGISALSATLGRHIWIDRGYYTLYPNLYIILVAGSARCAKSTSTNLAMDVVKKIKNPPMVFAQKVTTESLIEALIQAKAEGSCAGIIHASELNVFMTSESQKSGLIPVLTDLYDCPDIWTYSTRSHGREKMENVCLSFLAATTPEGLPLSIPPSAIGGGFTSRVVFVYQDRPSNDNMFPKVDATTQMKKVKLIEDLNIIRELRGPFSLTPDAVEYADIWYTNEAKKSRNSKLDGYFGRKHDTLLKIAMILSASESSNKMISLMHLKRGLGILDDNEINLDRMMSSISASVVGREMELILDIIIRDGMITHAQLMKKCWRIGTVSVLQEHLKTLEEGSEISSFRNENSKLCYKANKKE